MTARPAWDDRLRILQEVDSRRVPGAVLETSRGAIASNPAIAQVARLPGALTAAECRRTRSLAADLRFSAGAATYGGTRSRRCDCAWIGPSPEHRWLYERVAAVFARANEGYRFRLKGLIEPPMIVSYDPGGGFDWHLDLGPELAASRKLSLSLLLGPPGDYEGGELEFSGCVRGTAKPSMGTAMVFPSFLAHRVAPVTRGRRLALVAFAHGPSFA